MNTKLLRSKMVLFGDTSYSLAQALDISPQAFSLKLNGEREFKQEEIKIIQDRYNLSPDEVVDIFLT